MRWLGLAGGQIAKLDACAASVGFASPATVLEDAWAACAEKAALGWRFPDPRGQVTKLAVRYRPR